MPYHFRGSILPAVLVHVLTASGAVLALFALLAAAKADYEACFAWLGAALIVDGIDGPLARRFNVKRVLPRFSGEDLDNVIDYMTYVAIPAFIIATGPLVPASLAVPAAALIMLTSLYHFGDKDSKTDDGYFVGFPAVWNLVALYLLVVPVPQTAALAIIAVCAIFTFVPLKWLHPVRVRRLRPVTFAVMAVWAACAIAAVASGFPGSPAIQLVFLIALAYGIGISAAAGFVEKAAARPAE